MLRKVYFAWERVLVKAQILDSLAADPKTWTVLLIRTQCATHQRVYIRNFSSLGANTGLEIAHR
jgi:hypothetical protein